ncbi:hypothetical protein, partial [Janthinobacterium sp.]|uniref:hypothetical protein n=1 Tax=Janthinobacterium sp. TaxID=1871054 RepID=UPI002588B03E
MWAHFQNPTVGFWIGFWRNPLFCAPLTDYNSLDFAKYPPPPEVIIYNPFRGLYNTRGGGGDGDSGGDGLCGMMIPTPPQQQTPNPCFYFLDDSNGFFGGDNKT